MRIKVISQHVTTVKADLLIAGFFENCKPLAAVSGEVDWLYSGVLSKLIMDGKMSGQLGETLLLATHDRLFVNKVLFLGLGPKKNFKYSTINIVSKTVFDICRQMNVKDFVVDFLGVEENLDNGQAVEAFLNGFPKDIVKKQEDDEEEFFTITLLINDKDRAREIDRNIKILSRF